MALGKMAGGPVEGISTGSLTLDIALGGKGIPKGRIIEIYGAESSGKTTIALHAIANCQKDRCGVAAFIDAEHALDPSWAKKIGVKLDELLVLAAEQRRGGAEDRRDVSLVERRRSGGRRFGRGLGAEERNRGRDWRLARRPPGPPDVAGDADSDADRVASSKTCVIFINQIRQKVGVMYGPSETTSGGLALRFYASVRMEVRKAQQIKDGDEVLGVDTKVKVVKNKVAPPFRTAEFELMYDRGISIEGDILKLGEESKVLSKSGANYYYGEQRIGQGRENAKNYLRQNPAVREEIQGKISEKMMQLNVAMEDLPSAMTTTK